MAQIDKPNLHFNPRLYTATGSALSVTGVGFQPDLVWIKDRDSTGWHFWTDAVRGVTKTIFSNTNNAESTETGGLTAFGTDGYSIGTHSNINTNGNDLVSMNWKAGTTSGLSGGTITPSSYSINTTSGFGIYTYTGTGSAGTIAHGLGSTPKLIIVKCRSNADTWAVYHADVGATKYLELDTNVQAQTSTVPWNNTEPTSSVFTVGTWSATNGSGRTYVAYCFAEKTGYSKFGSYTANNSSDGPFIYTGFKPAFFIAKRDGGTGNFHIYDNKRLGYNNQNKRLRADQTDAEDQYSIDIVSNGIKIRTNNNSLNNHTGNMVYWAFAEAPIVGTNNIPATAR